MMNLKENLSIAKEIAREAGNFLLDNKNKTKQIFSFIISIPMKCLSQQKEWGHF